MGSVFHDLRIGLRSLRRQPGFSAAAVGTLALGIGAATAIFAVAEAALLRPLPFREPDRLKMVWGVAGPERDVRGASPIEIADWRRLTSSFETLSLYDQTTVNLSGVGEARQLDAELVAPGFFRMLGVAPAIGRTLAPEDDRPGAVGAALISDDLWRSQFGGDPGVVGRTIRLDDRPFTIAGVMPPRFKGLSFGVDVWAPLGPFMTESSLQSRGSRWLGAVGRLKPGVSPQTAQADLDAAAGRLAELYPETNRERGAQLIAIKTFYLDSARSLLFVLLSGVGLLLLIACANVANLQVVRTSDRQRELSLRHALGAGRGRVARQLVTESLALSIVGGALGVLVAWVGLGLLLPLIPAGALPQYVQVRMSPLLVGFAVLLSLLAGGVVGLVAAMRSDRDPAGALKGSRSSGSGWRAGRLSLQQVLVGGEVAVALVLLVAAGLALRSFRSQLAIDPGFHPEGVLAASVSLTGDRYDPETRRTFITTLRGQLHAAPGVRDVAIVSDAPLRGGFSASLLTREGEPDERIRFYLHRVSDGYFRTLGIPLLRGRGFDSSDRPDGPGVTVVSDAFARRIWPGQDAIGKRVRLGDDYATVIGIAGDVHYRDLTTSLMDPSDDPDLYFSVVQVTPRSFDILLRGAGDPAALTAELRRVVARLDPSIPVYQVEPLAKTLASQTALARLTSFLLGLFGGLSLLLAVVGLYGVMAFIVRGRRREIAIRSAIGARPDQIQRLVLGQGMAVVGIGLVLGLGGALLAGRLLAGLLFDTRAVNPLVLAGTAVALGAAALLANWLPARQATRLEPRTALAEE